MAIPSELQYILNVNKLYLLDMNSNFIDIIANVYGPTMYGDGPSAIRTTLLTDSVTYCGVNLSYNHNGDNPTYTNVIDFSSYEAIVRIDVDTQSQQDVVVSYGTLTPVKFVPAWNNNIKSYRLNFSSSFGLDNDICIYSHGTEYASYIQASFSTLSDAIAYIYQHYANIILYVDGEKWVDPTPVLYTWQSVPSISGKNGILSLTQIASASINDGEAVSGASASAFDILESSSRIDALVNVAELDNGKARATYTIPPLTSGSYSYAKLTYNRGHIPTNKDDGTSVDLDTTDLGTTKTIDVSGIITGSVYWFVIFTDKSESEPKQLGANTEGLFFQIDLSTDGKDIVRYDASKTINNHKQGELYNNAGNPGYTISDGVLDVTSVGNQRDIEWAYDTSENPQTIPQNCTLTFEYDCYFPNGEGYLDWYVYDSNQMQVIYWCFDTKFSFQANKWYNCKTVCKLVDGKITRCKYVVDGVEVSGGSITPINMPCTDKEGSEGISYIDFNLTQRTKFKNMSIYYDFSEYTDHGGSGSGSSGQS